MTLEDDNKAEEAATSTTSSSTSSSTSSGASTSAGSVQSSSGPPPPPPPSSSSSSGGGGGGEQQLADSTDGLVISTSGEVVVALDGESECSSVKQQMKQKRSFDEISQCNNPITSTEDTFTEGTNPTDSLITKCDVDNSDSNDITTTNEEIIMALSDDKQQQQQQQEEKMITDESVIVAVEETDGGEEVEAKPEPVLVRFKVVYAKQPYELSMDLNASVAVLKTALYTLTGVTEKMQKLCFRGNLDDSKSLLASGIKDGVKIMMIGSKMDDIKGIDSNKPDASKLAVKEKPTKEPLCQQKQHKKILDKGVPEYATLGWINEHCDLPPEPLTGMTNKYGNKVRLTFKFESDEVWIGTKEHTQKLQMTNVKSVLAEAIDNHPEYHMVGLQVGPTEASRIWFYWVPSQYVKAIKRAILGD